MFDLVWSPDREGAGLSCPRSTDSRAGEGVGALHRLDSEGLHQPGPGEGSLLEPESSLLHRHGAGLERGEEILVLGEHLVLAHRHRGEQNAARVGLSHLKSETYHCVGY